MSPVHFVVVTIGSAGDLFPFMRVALAVHGAGHRVTMLGPQQHAPFVAQAGLAFHGLPADDAVLDHPDLWHPTRGLAVVWRATRPAMALIPGFVAALPAGERIVLLAHPLALPEADLCRAGRPGLKVAAAYLAPSNLPTVHDPLMLGPWAVPRWVPLAARRWLWRSLGERLINQVALPDVNAARATHGLAPVADLVEHIVRVPDLSVTLFPEWFAPTQPDWPQPMLRAGFPLYDPNPHAGLAPEIARFIEAGAPPVVFTPGTGNRQAAYYFRCALAACARRGLRAIFLTPHRGQLPAHLPSPVLWQDYVPLRALLPHVAALVHHGGIGTTAEALRAGTPQLVVPLAHDQFDNAARVRALGVGASLRAARLAPGPLAGALGRVAGAAVASRAKEVSRRFRAPDGIDSVVARLAALADHP
ncbi:glycosyltransferase [Massilia yuzhufengensis]|uniref:UDP:flavonoid glycosyltransferase YjiC, YdhE family n=1 Tax=Massilia yuzhufengensis TaxID=1164594 RepID=A0A1I1NKA5_9BURK|nr:glycosyltransferase [Massilia yuzhufengensis]SFC97915.1 UDP:flavonoid glycosyltransferase YjiC, YdhE family [Massilia yuzhufengensis]